MSHHTNGYIKTFLTGGVIGATLALLYTPKSGREIRKNLRRGLHRANEKVGDLREQAEDIMAEGRKQAKALRQQAEDILDEAKTAAEHLIAKIR
jgi:gas vesicle protein